jgi:hypothetical protein
VTVIIRWKEPPPHGNTKPKVPSKYQPHADALRRRPGRWGVVAEGMKTGTAATLSHKIRTGQGPWAPGGFESRVVGTQGSTNAVVYARYVGEVTA